MFSKSTAVAAALMPFCMAGPASAQQTQQFSSIVFGTQISESRLQLEGSDAYATFATDEVVVATDLDKDHPLQNLSGKCAGVAEKAEGKTRVSGHCAYSNLAGGKVALYFVVDSSLAPEWDGSFELSGLEGNAAGWKASCKWGKTVDFSNGRYVQRWLCSARKA